MQLGEKAHNFMELEEKKQPNLGMCFLLTDHSLNEEVCWRLSSTNWAANPFLEIPHEWTCAKLRSTPRQDASSLKHIILFGWRSPSPTRFRIPTSDEYLRPILIDPEISIHFSYFCGKKDETFWWSAIVVQKKPASLAGVFSEGVHDGFRKHKLLLPLLLLLMHDAGVAAFFWWCF